MVEKDVSKANSDIARVLGHSDLSTIPEDTETMYWPPRRTYSLLSKEFLNKHGRDLFACSAAWMIVDIPFYSSTLSQSKIYKPWIDPENTQTAYQEAINVAKFQAVMAIASTIPGYWATVLFIDRAGRRKIQMMGFLFMAIFLFSLGGACQQNFKDKKNWGFMILYGLTFFFSNFGPNTTTFIVPAELFPARFRSTCHGISGATGKVGAIVGAIGFLLAIEGSRGSKLNKVGMMYAFMILGGVCIVGLALTYFFTPETKGRSLEDNEEEDGN